MNNGFPCSAIFVIFKPSRNLSETESDLSCKVSFIPVLDTAWSNLKNNQLEERLWIVSAPSKIVSIIVKQFLHDRL